MAAAEPWFIGERAEALATMYLTRRQDLTVLPATTYGPDTGSSIRVQVGDSNTTVPIEFCVKPKESVGRTSKQDNLLAGHFP